MSKHHLDEGADSDRSNKRVKSNGVRTAHSRTVPASHKSQPSFVPPRNDLADLSAPAGPSKTDPSEDAAIAAKRAEVALKFKQMMANKGGTALVPFPVPKPATAAPLSELQKKIAEAKKKVEAMASAGPSNPYTALGSKAKTATAVAPALPASSSLHPLLSSGTSNESYKPVSNKDRYKPMQPKFATTSANARAIMQQPVPAVRRSLEQSAAPTLEEARKNPYFDRRLGVESLAPKDRKARPLKFSQKGKYVALAEHKRAEIRQEEMRQRILEMAAKTGMGGEIDGMARRAKKQPPPPIEWWDALFLPNETYDDLDEGIADAIIAKEDPEKGISRYIQHPIKVPAPQDKIQVEAKALMLTPKEQKKLRRTTRAAALQDKRDRQKMGLLPPDPPKIKISNMMRVLKDEGVADPTKVEARARREMMQRHDKHVQDNQERKLTAEEKAAKMETKAEEDAERGIHVAVFKVGHLQHKSHHFKVRKNAEQLKLTGCVIFNPKFVFVLVEGGEKAIKKYKHLMLERMNWDEDAPPEHEPIDEEDDTAYPAKHRTDVPLGENYCQLVWGGTHRERLFDTWRLKNCPSDGLAREWLGSKAEGYWEMARSKAEQGI